MKGGYNQVVFADNILCDDNAIRMKSSYNVVAFD